MRQYLTNEEIIKKHAKDWMQWHEKCREQVLMAMEDVVNTKTDEIVVFLNEIKNDKSYIKNDYFKNKATTLIEKIK